MSGSVTRGLEALIASRGGTTDLRIKRPIRATVHYDRSRAEDTKSVAVLPFESLSGNPGNEPFTIGIQALGHRDLHLDPRGIQQPFQPGRALNKAGRRPAVRAAGLRPAITR